MIATRRGLAVLASIAAVLLVVLVVDLVRTPARTDRTLVPGLDETTVTRLAWTAHPVGPYLTIERALPGPWRRSGAVVGAVEQAPVASLLAALRGARWHRARTRDPRANTTQLAIDHAKGRLELWIGAPDPTTEQAWIGIGDRDYLVDAWVARALVPSPLDLAVKTPLAGIASVPEYTVDGVHVAGSPRRIAPRSPDTTGTLVLDPAFANDLERALAELAIEALPPAPMGHGEVIVVEMAGTRVALGGPCEQRVYLASSTGDGCVSREKADAVRALVEKLRGPRAAIASRSPVPVGVRSVSLVDDAKLDLERRPTIDGADANVEAVVALMTVLRSPVDAADVVAAPTTEPIETLTVAVERGDAMVLSLHAGNLIARAGEAVALRLSPDAFALLRRGAAAYRDPTPWREEPTTIDELRIDGITYKRGAVIGEWIRTPAGPSDAASIEALVRALAEPRVLRVAPATLGATRRVELIVRPPTGGEKSHILEIGAATAAGCPAKIGATTVLLSVEICRLVPR